MSNLPILWSREKDYFVRGEGASTEYLIPGWMIIREQFIRNRGIYMIPGEDLWVNAKQIHRYLWYQRPEELMDCDISEYNGCQRYYDRLFLNITTESQRPKCDNCGDLIPFNKLSKGYCHVDYNDQERYFCSLNCRAEYYNSKRLIGFGLQADNRDKYKLMDDYWDYGGGLKQAWEAIKSDPTGKLYPNMRANCSYDRLKEITESSFETGIYHSTKLNRDLTYRSSWERLVYEKLDSDSRVVYYKEEPQRISYQFEGQEFGYYPDLLIILKGRKKYLVEIKPSNQVHWEINQVKFKYARKYCEENSITWLVWTEYQINSDKLPFPKFRKINIHNNEWYLYYDSREGKCSYCVGSGAFINGHKWALVRSKGFLNKKSVDILVDYFNNKLGSLLISYSESNKIIYDRFKVTNKVILGSGAIKLHYLLNKFNYESSL